MLGAVAEYERVMIALRLRSRRSRKAANGGYAFSAPGFGYRAESGSLVPIPDEQVALDRMRDVRESGVTYEAIARALQQEGDPTKRGGEWQGKVVRAALARKVR